MDNVICEGVQRKCEDGECDDMGNEGNGFVGGLVMVAFSVVCLCVVRVRFVYGSCNGRLPDF